MKDKTYQINIPCNSFSVGHYHTDMVIDVSLTQFQFDTMLDNIESESLCRYIEQRADFIDKRIRQAAEKLRQSKEHAVKVLTEE